MTQSSCRFITLSDMGDDQEIEIEAAKDGSLVSIRSGAFEMTIPAESFFEFVGACISVDTFLSRLENKKKAH